jgi:DNA mismatch repair protein MutS
MMAQWTRCKEQAGDAILLFRLGDFYEAFHDDALIVSSVLDLTLTKRQEYRMCGIPWHTCDNYIDRLLVKGYSVAIAEQTPGADKTLMDRQIVRIVTPATAMRSSLIKDSANTLMAAMAYVEGRWGVAIVDITTALFQVFESDDRAAVLRELFRLAPKELLCCEPHAQRDVELFHQLEDTLALRKKTIPSWTVEQTTAVTLLQNHFKTATLDGFGLRDVPAAVCAAGGLLCHLKDTLLVAVTHLTTIEVLSSSSHMILDRSTMTNLEIFQSSSVAGGGTCLFDILNDTKTPMGARLLRQWLSRPLTEAATIDHRHHLVEACCQFETNEPSSSAQACHALSHIRDLERLILRIQTGGAGPRDVLFLASCASHIDPLLRALEPLNHVLLNESLRSIPSCDELITRIQTTLSDEPPLRIADGGTIRQGVNEELDELRHILHDGHEWLSAYQSKLRDELQIKTLKVGFTRAFGYYIEVSRGQAERVPSSFCRRQTLTSAERYISEELKHFEDQVLTAEKRIEGIETALFDELKSLVISYVPAILAAAKAIAEIDLYLGLARIALQRGYVRPRVITDPILSIVGGRHPIAETRVTSPFVHNDLSINATGPSLLLITGPNMAGKSTFIRQAALLVIMAQMGSFIPATEATIGIVDRVFSRVGASDDLFRGQSTFMVEMAETASILNQATAQSLVLLDEIGRGTSTYDGISIAWAVAEYLVRHANANARTLFATHYYELTELEQKFPCVKNMTVAVAEQADGIRFLYKVIPGKTDRSYGIHVAKLAGLPRQVLQRAESVLLQLEERRPRSGPVFVPQDLFTVNSEPKAENPDVMASYEFLRDLDLVSMTPMDCFVRLMKFKNSIGRKK